MGASRHWQILAAVVALAAPAGAEPLADSKWERFSDIEPGGALAYRYVLKSDAGAALVLTCWPAAHNIRIAITSPTFQGPRRSGLATFNRLEGGMSQVKTVVSEGSADADALFGALVLHDRPGEVFVAVEGQRFRFEPFGLSTVNADAVKHCRL